MIVRVSDLKTFELSYRLILAKPTLKVVLKYAWLQMFRQESRER